MFRYAKLMTGDPAPWFQQRAFGNPRYVFDTAAGRYIVLCFFGSAGEPQSKAALDAILSRRQIFDDERASFFGISIDPGDEQNGRVADIYPGFRYFWDFDGAVSRLYGALPQEAEASKGPFPLHRRWVVVDPTLRILRVIPFAEDGGDLPALFDYLDTLPPPGEFAGIELQAPIIMLPHVFEPAFCRDLISLYETNGGEESGFMREVDGKTVAVHDYHHKRRRDYNIEDQNIIIEAQRRFKRRINPEIEKIHQFIVTRMERYIVACYAAEDEAHFRPHRDNTTAGTAHRRFAVSINLNDDFDGGELCFPEYGRRSFKPPVGGAVVFSCSLLHAVTKVTRGRRFAFLPFLYDDAAAKLRERNNSFLGEGVGPYKSGLQA